MGNRTELHSELIQFLPTVYFQSPGDEYMTYPCIVYHKNPPDITFADNHIYKSMDQYTVQVIERDPDSTTIDDILKHFAYCSPGSYFVNEGLYHKSVTLYY